MRVHFSGRLIDCGTFALASMLLGCAADSGAMGSEGAPGTGVGEPVSNVTGSEPGAVTPTGCPIATLLQEHCQNCHNEYLVAGAPMPLMTWDDLRAPARSDPSIPVYQMIQRKVRDPRAPMPPTGQLSEGELAIIDQWIASGAPDCGIGAGSSAGSGSTPAGSGSGGSTSGSGTGTGTSSGPAPAPTDPFAPPPPPPDEAELCFEFRARAPGNPSAPYQVRPGQHYYNFVFQAPYDAEVLGLTFDALVESSVVHHFLLFEYLGNDVPVDYEGIGIHPNSQLLTGWAPGGEPPDMPPGVGFKLPAPGRYYELEIHYFNSTQTVAEDTSGIRICATTQPTQHVASLTWLGTENIVIDPLAESRATGTCTPGNPRGEDIHIIASVPHMHQVGSHMTTVINRANGTQETLLDEPFEFLDQRTYNTPAVVHPGDTLTTTCTYRNNNPWAIYFGPGSESEMCYNFVVSYPADALAHPGFSLEASANTCLW